ncbi:MAG: type II secretion system protein GspG, partial [Deltaproteobacteria bacterium]|nr:type II secretion system protein GspG [Deltaproteobacteria bacterium]
YEQPGQNNSHSFDLWSYGSDEKPGGEGVDADIGNWDEGGDRN